MIGKAQVSLPQDIPPGLYDLSIRVSGSRGDFTRQSPRSVYVVRDYPKDPVFMTFGHLDTQGQYQAEYERRLAEIANLIAPDRDNPCHSPEGGMNRHPFAIVIFS